MYVKYFKISFTYIIQLIYYFESYCETRNYGDHIFKKREDTVVGYLVNDENTKLDCQFGQSVLTIKSIPGS
jgi:hypothetical protein